jgi:hypothetical protein
LVIATLTDTPTATMVETPRLQRRVKGGATHRSDAVRPGQHHIGWRRTQFGQQRGARAAWGDVDTASDGEDLRVVVGAESVGPPVNEAVHDLHPGTRAAGNSRAMLGTASRRASSARTASPAFGPTTAPWHSCVTIAVFGRHQLGEWDFHAETVTSALGGTS